MRKSSIYIAAVLLVAAAPFCRASQIQIELDDTAAKSQTAANAGALVGGAPPATKILVNDNGQNPSTLAEVAFGVTPQAFTDPGFTLAGTYNLSGTSITGGSVLLDMTTGADVSFTITGGTVTNLGGGFYDVNANISNLNFTTSTFAGVNISTFFGAQPLVGTVDFTYQPDTSGPSLGVDSDVSQFTITAVTVPEPSSIAVLGIAGMCLLGPAGREANRELFEVKRDLMVWKVAGILAAVVTVLAVNTPCRADAVPPPTCATILQVSGMSVTASPDENPNNLGGPFNASYTGTLTFSELPTTLLKFTLGAGATKQTSKVADTVSTTPLGISGTITFSDGWVTGGNLVVATTVTSQLSQLGVAMDPLQNGNSMSPTLGQVLTNSSTGFYSLSAATKNGAFTAPTFAGVSLTAAPNHINWQGPLPGSVSTFSFSPGNQSANFTLIENATLVPLPRAIAGGVLLLSVLAVGHRRGGVMKLLARLTGRQGGEVKCAV